MLVVTVFREIFEEPATILKSIDSELLRAQLVLLLKLRYEEAAMTPSPSTLTV